MAKKTADKKPDAKAPEAPKPEAPKAVPNKSAWADKAATAEEAKKLGFAHPGMKKPRALVIDAKKKAKALELMAEHAALQEIVVGAREVPGVKGTDAFRAARDDVKAKKEELNQLYAGAADSVQAAETEFAAQA